MHKQLVYLNKKYLLFIILISFFSFTSGQEKTSEKKSSGIRKSFIQRKTPKDSVNNQIMFPLEIASWQKDRDDFISMLEGLRSQIKLSDKRRGTAVQDSGANENNSYYSESPATLAALLRFSSSSPAILIPLIAIGGIWGISTLIEKSEDGPCIEYLNTTIIQFKSYWNQNRYPATPKEMEYYNAVKDQILKTLGKMDCL